MSFHGRIFGCFDKKPIGILSAAAADGVGEEREKRNEEKDEKEGGKSRRPPTANQSRTTPFAARLEVDGLISVGDRNTGGILFRRKGPKGWRRFAERWPGSVFRSAAAASAKFARVGGFSSSSFLCWVGWRLDCLGQASLRLVRPRHGL